MKRRIVKRPEHFVSIVTETPKLPEWDSDKFQDMPKEKLIEVYNKHYQKHTDKLLELVASRMAIGTAITGINKYIKNHGNESVVLDEDNELTAEIDNIFEKAIVMYVTEHALNLSVTEEFMREIQKQLPENIRGLLPKRNPEDGSLLGVLATHSKGKQHEDNISRIARKTNIELDKPENPYGEHNGEPQGKDGKLPKAKNTPPGGVIQRSRSR